MQTAILLSIFQLICYNSDLSEAKSCWRDTSCTGPSTAAFKGEWDKNIQAPNSRTIRPKSVLSLPKGELVKKYDGAIDLSSKKDGVVLDFGVEVGGIISVDYNLTEGIEASLGLAFTEAKDYIGRLSDNSNGDTINDGALMHKINTTGPQIYTIPDSKLRGGFRYLTLFLESEKSAQVNILDIALEISFQPTWADLKAYQGYFHSSNTLINKIWYSGAYTLQTNSVPGKTGRIEPRSRSGWQNDEYIGPGDTVLLDGAKRDRWVWIGDMGTAVPSAFVSTGDIESTKNALLAIYNNQVGFILKPYTIKDDGALPKAGPPHDIADSDTYHLWALLGTYAYFLYSGDQTTLSTLWPKYLLAMNNSLSKVNGAGIMSVTGIKDWGRTTFANERASANKLLYRALTTGAELAAWAPTLAGAKEKKTDWTNAVHSLQTAIMAELWDDSRGAFTDGPGNTSLYPQDGNSMAIAFGVVKGSSDESRRISDYLASNWTPIGPSCPELPDNVSPFISSIEIVSHFRAGRPDRGFKLIKDAWGWYLANPNGTQSTVPEGYLIDGSWGYRGDYGYRQDPSYVSHAHGWSSGPTSALTEYAVGLRVTKPRGQEWVLEPTSFNELHQAEAGFTTALGKFSASYTLRDKKLIVSWDCPKKTRGQIIVQNKKIAAVKGGKGSISVSLK
ncbi:hypothetical protein NW762_012825 [Fusarium torreyae]|uniref:Alpha-L-rhamnosidase six-hairpin glycosidase domain-containing protein n=1 Tax=Fusarium torreyae TaxID=1237075 RepID=A0A9W8VB68_9HYPO|nr:hypothetical protein NW762_012825 [Fusarium torreyae]